jgi:lipoate-protein ligase A
MNLQAKKLSFIKGILQIPNEAIIDKLEKMLEKQMSDFSKDKPHSLSLDEFYNDIDQSLEDSTNDSVISAQDLKKEVKNWR